MFDIKIDSECKNTEDLALLLEHIADQIKKGYTSGYEFNATWRIIEGEEPGENDDSLVPA